MTLRRLDTRCLIRPEDVPPSRDDCEVIGAFNPGVIEQPDGGVTMLVRIAERARETRGGYCGCPRFEPDGTPVVDWIDEQDVDYVDPRIIANRKTGYKRLTFASHLLAVHSEDGRTFDPAAGTRVFPRGPYETFGIEDPRISRVDGEDLVTYVGVSLHGVVTSLMSTTDWQTFERRGIIFTRENKDVVLFPQKVGGKYAAIHRPTGAFVVAPAEMWYASSPDLVHWGEHRVLFSSLQTWDNGRIGGGCPPLRTAHGWLKIYHGTAKPRDSPVGRYCGAALLLDLDEPWRVIGYTEQPILEPEADFEKRGFVNEVIFPTGIVQREDRLMIYCGASDAYVGLVELSLSDVLGAMTRL